MYYVTLDITSLVDCELCYKFRIQVSNGAVAPSTLPLTIQLEIGDGTTWTNLGAGVTVDGVYEFDIDAALCALIDPDDPFAPNNFNFIRYQTQDDNADVDILGLFLDVDCAETLCSECFDLKDSHDCTGSNMLITWTNQNNFLLSNGLSLNYSDFNWTQNLRVFGSLEASDYPYLDEDVFKYSNGDYGTQYIDSEEVLELLIQDIPPYLHNALRLGLVHDTVKIDGVRITKVPGSYTPDRVKESKLAPIILEVKGYNQRDINKLC